LALVITGLLSAQNPPPLDMSRLPESLQPPFFWQVSELLIRARQDAADDYYSLKDPSIVEYQEAWHLFGTVRGRKRSHQVEYLRFRSFEQAAQGERTLLTMHPHFYCAPQIFFFRPHQTWYLICQASDPQWVPNYGPAFATNQNIADVNGWSPLRPLQHRKSTSNAELDFWVICDSQKAYLFFTSLDGRMWREETRLEDFPHGWSDPVVALEADIFEASHTYKVQQSDWYLTLIEAQRSQGGRYYKAYVADRLDGTWQPLATEENRCFAGPNNIRFAGDRWSDWISHGELLRAEYDERLEIAPTSLRFVFQGVTAAEAEGKVYGQIPWRLGLLTQTTASLSDDER
jgi:hypothetical protein